MYVCVWVGPVLVRYLVDTCSRMEENVKVMNSKQCQNEGQIKSWELIWYHIFATNGREQFSY